MTWGGIRFFTTLKHIYLLFRCIFVLITRKMLGSYILNISMRKKQGKICIAYLTERFGLVSYSYIIVHGVKLYNMGRDPFFTPLILC